MGQKKLSEPQFSIRATRAYNVKNNSYAAAPKRQADVYVFCIQNYKKKDDGLNPLNLQQWEFYVISTKNLNEKLAQQKSVSLGKLKKIGAIFCQYEDLAKTIENIEK